MGDASIEIPKTGKAACVVNPGPDFSVALEEVDVPKPGYGEVLIRLSCTGICYSDLHYMLQDLPIPAMSDFGVRSPGHEGIGKIVSIGEGVKDFQIGERVGLKPAWDSCNYCELCCSDREMYCTKSRQTGLHKAGTYQQYVLGSADHTMKIPDGVKDEVAAPIMCSGATIYRAITEAGLKPGNWVVFSGAGGGVGHMGVQYAKAMGMRVIGIDGGSHKEELCKKIGAEHFIDFTKVKDIPAEVVKLADGLGAHGLIVTASNSAAYKGGLGMLRTSGIMMCIGLTPLTDTPSIADPLSLIGKNVKVTGTIVGTRNDVRKALEFAAQGLVSPVITQFPWEKLPEAVQKLRSGQVAGRCVVNFD